MEPIRDGRNGQRLDEINAIMNSIPSETLGGVSPADMLESVMTEPRNVAEDVKFRAIVRKARTAMVQNARKRRGPSTDKPFEEGDWVRQVNPAYVKAGLRGNDMKFQPRYSAEIFRIRRVSGGPRDGEFAPYRYQIESFDRQNPAAPTRSP
eukprot:COSAG05_NODE_4442_length_1511_cov_1.296322_1_plen_150_part_10